jgi:hypothetical protein
MTLLLSILMIASFAAAAPPYAAVRTEDHGTLICGHRAGRCQWNDASGAGWGQNMENIPIMVWLGGVQAEPALALWPCNYSIYVHIRHQPKDVAPAFVQPSTSSTCISIRRTARIKRSQGIHPNTRCGCDSPRPCGMAYSYAKAMNPPG